MAETKMQRSKNDETGEPCFFERSGAEFNPHTGMGGMEVWVPVKS
jgi:predicted transcriptional regulator YdeE